MKRTVAPLLLALFGLFTASLTAQETVPLTPATTHSDSLTVEETDTYTLQLDAEQFVFGQADQQTVDVVITVYDPDGERIARVNGPARGPETFQFDSDEAGEYRIEVTPFEEEEGRYTILLQRVEPLATRPEARVDQLMAAYSGDDVPGGVVGVIRDGELVFSEAYGAANLTHGVPFTPETRTNIGSTSKQFTGYAIALLAERGELSLDDDVRTHIPEIPDFGHTVRLRNMVSHTSGYREFVNALVLGGRLVLEGDYVGRYEVLDLVQRQPELQNIPGEEFNYNNTAFSLLTLVVERVTGQPFEDWMEENVFQPLGMRNTVVRADRNQIIPNSSQGYVPAEERGWREVGDLGAAMGAGGIYTTPSDLAIWIDNFDEPRVGSPRTFETMTTRHVLIDGDTTSYGLGLFVDEYRGLERVHHGGADVAHRSMLLYFPELDAGVITLSNNATFNSSAMANDVADAFFEEHMEPEEEAEGVVAGTAEGETFDPETYAPEDFDPLAGRYALDAAPAVELSFSRDGETLLTQVTGQPEIEIVPTSDSTFALTEVDASVTFHRDPDGSADSVTLHQNGDHLARRVEGGDWEPTPAELEAYTGRYFSEELETFYTIALEEGELVLRHRRIEDDIALTPASEQDEFTGSFPITQLDFVRDGSGAVIGLEAGNGRTRDVLFDRVEEEGYRGAAKD